MQFNGASTIQHWCLHKTCDKGTSQAQIQNYMDKMAEKRGGGVEVGAGLPVLSWMLGEVCSCVEQAHIHFPRTAIIAKLKLHRIWWLFNNG